MGKLVLLRHGESVWNQENIFTGWVNIPLSERGIEEAFMAGEALKDLPFDTAFTSSLLRAQMTLFLALSRNRVSKTPYLITPLSEERKEWGAVYSEEAKGHLFPVFVSEALNERYYGELQGKNKEEVKKIFGDEQFQKWRRSYDNTPPKGESLEMTRARTLPYFQEKILPLLQKEKRILISAHGNSLRSLVMEIEGLSKEEVVALEIPTGEPLFYEYREGVWHKGGV